MLWAALGLVACGPGLQSGDASSSDASGTNSDTSQSSDPSGTEPTGPDPTGVTGNYCGEDAPAEPAATDTCTDPVEIMQETPDGPRPTGFFRCAGGIVHREAKIDCVYMPDPAPGCAPDDAGNECTTPEECNASPNGYCVSLGMEGTCSCAYGCTTDADCGSGNVCFCNGYTTECVPASCTTDADCGGYQCAKNYGSGFSCQTPFDECRGDADCTGEECPSCAPDANACAWTCQPSEFGCTTAGRPLRVDGRELRADVVARTDWRTAAQPSSASAFDRARLATYWRAAGQMEHASVASFARFALQLVGLGAPPELLVDTTSAMRDEVEHARVMFGLASADGDEDVGPGALVVGHAGLGAHDLVSVADDVMREACIAETFAAVELAEAARGARAPERRGLLETIAADELRHAALGWRFMKWALAKASSAERRAIVANLHDAIAEAAAVQSSGLDGLREHGVLDARSAAACRTDALAQVIRPLVAGLLAAEPVHAGCSLSAAVA